MSTIDVAKELAECEVLMQNGIHSFWTHGTDLVTGSMYTSEEKEMLRVLAFADTMRDAQVEYLLGTGVIDEGNEYDDMDGEEWIPEEWRSRMDNLEDEMWKSDDFLEVHTSAVLANSEAMNKIRTVAARRQKDPEILRMESLMKKVMESVIKYQTDTLGKRFKKDELHFTMVYHPDNGVHCYSRKRTGIFE